MYDKAFLPLGIECVLHSGKNNFASSALLMRLPGVGEAERNEIIIELAETGVSCNVHYKPLPMLTAYKNLGFNIEDYPNAYDVYRNEITFPLH